MERKLHWNAIGLESKTNKLINSLQIVLDQIPDSHSNKRAKIENFIEELEFITKQITKIKEKLIPSLEKEFHLNFKTPELVYISLCRPSIRNIFIDTKIFFSNRDDNPLSLNDYDDLAASGDASNVLALVGDSVLDLVVIQYFWDSSLSTAGKLSKRRATIVKNSNLAKACDEWKLYEYRLHRYNSGTEPESDSDTLIHEKGTLIESLFGVIFIEFGFDELTRIIPKIQ
jgi:dsRNA-specific ribonuclease